MTASPPHRPRSNGRRWTLSILLLPLLFGGCAQLNCTPLERVLGGPTNLINFAYRITDNLSYQAIPPLLPNYPAMPILVTTFVDNNDLEQTSNFGRILQEHISSRLVQLGYAVREIKIAQTLEITPRSGETILSRDLSRISADQPAQAILVGTYARSNRVLYISARLINPKDNTIIAADDHRLCMDDELLAMFGLQRRSPVDEPIRDPGRPLLNSVL